MASSFSGQWVKTLQPTHLWSGPTAGAVDYGSIPQASYLLVVAPQQLARFYVYVPWTQNYAYVDATSVAPSGAPPATVTPAPTVSPAPVSMTPTSTASPALPLSSPSWTGWVVGGGARIRTAASAQANILRRAPDGTVVNVVAWVAGDAITPGNWTWAKLVDGTYAYSTALQIIPPTMPPAPPTNHPTGRWIDVNTLQETVVAYDGDTPVHLAIGSTGSPGWETPLGIHQIIRRVADETMDSSTLVGLDATHQAEANYYLVNVLDTQYFDDNAEALHDNYWLPDAQFGIPHSHGCVGLRLADATWFWNWASLGTPVVVHDG
jgi:lipoprotein-anchoring transpeptidase ErfK/SrfK